ncbi:MAG TPA: DNA primase, partial [Candidatus Saccharimonadales bacterium]|nr:DNA primase [Candidatus Saccharimonadales bacterium]
MDPKEEVRERLNIEDVIGQYMQLKRAGRNWKGLSPFSAEKTPSFMVSPDKQIWHDFSSNRGGDVFSFVMEVEGLEFRQALEMLARQAGVDLSQYDRPGTKDRSKLKNRLLKLIDLSATYYQRQLIANPTAIDYVSKKRGLNRQTVLDFRIGYAPNSGLISFLKSKQYSDQDIKSAGLVNSRGQEMFRDRMMVPLSDGQGQVVGFTARLIKDVDGAPKYINTPATLLYDKGRQVFGLAQAKQAIRKNGYVVIVEGNLDVVSSHQAGVKNVVATAGTAMTEMHLKSLKRLTGDVRLAFDADAAGLNAAERAIGLAQNVGLSLNIVVLPIGAKDPDDLIKSEPEAWRKVIEQPRPAIEWLIDHYSVEVDITTAAGKQLVATKALAIIAKLNDPVEREHYLQLLSGQIGISLSSLEERLEQLKAPASKLKTVKVDHIEPENYAHEDYLLALLTVEPTAQDIARKLEVEDFHGEERRMLFRYLRDDPKPFKADRMPKTLHEIETYVKLVLFKAETRYEDLSGQDRLVEAVALTKRLKAQHL